MRVLIPLVIVAALAVACGASAEPARGVDVGEWPVSKGAAAPAQPCDAAAAPRVDIADLAKRPAAFLGRCVTVSGYLSGPALFSAQRDAATPGALTATKLVGARVGVYGPPMGPSAVGALRIALGRVGDCAQLTADGAMVFGYCHYAAGPYLQLTGPARSE